MSITFNLPRHGFSIKEGGDASAEVRMLLPPLGRVAATLVAVDGRHGLVVGAAATTVDFRAKPPIGPAVAVHVIPPCRRQGVGAALLDEIARVARARGARAVYTARRVLAGSDEARACEWLGFAPSEQVLEHELPLDRFEPVLAPLHERMKRRGRIPAEARIVPLYAADREAVLDLHSKHMGGDRDSLAARMDGRAPSAFHPRYSRVLMIEQRVVGCILAHRKARDIAVVDANIVSPELRGGWANIWLKLEATRGALSLGIKRFHFSSFDHYEDTRSFTHKLGGVTTQTTMLMRRNLA